jgi:predicted acetyltransferase
MEYRPIPDAHRDTYDRIANYAFAAERGPEFDFESKSYPEVYEPRGLYDAPSGTDGEDLDAGALRAICGYYDFTARVRGEWHPLAGIATVASPPETRRKGHVTRLLDSVHEELREAGTCFAALWPFDYEFYRRMGYAAAGARAVAIVPPSELASVAADDGGSFRRLRPDDRELLDGVHREWATEGLALRRTEGWWRHRVFSTGHVRRYVFGWFDEGGDLRGYVAYRIEDESERGSNDTTAGKTMDVTELAAVDERARRQLLRFCQNHDSQVDRVRLAGEGRRLLETLADPDAADAELRPGPMVRAVDLPAAVAALSFPREVDGSLVVAVDDERCPWNDGTFAIRVADGDATCESTGESPDLSADVASLSLVLLGVRGVDRLRRDGDLSVRSEGAAATLAAMCPPEPTRLRERF